MRRGRRNRHGRSASGNLHEEGAARNRGAANRRGWMRVGLGLRFWQRSRDQDAIQRGMQSEQATSSPPSRNKELSTLVERLRDAENRKKKIDQQITEIRKGENKKTKAYVDQGKCVGCGICVDTCPVDAVTLKEEKAVISDDCVACGQCLNVCPVQAISIE